MGQAEARRACASPMPSRPGKPPRTRTDLTESGSGSLKARTELERASEWHGSSLEPAAGPTSAETCILKDFIENIQNMGIMHVCFAQHFKLF